MRKLLFNPFRRERTERELDDELRFYVEALAEEKTRGGMTPDEALRAARIQFGGVEQVKEQVRDVRSGAWLSALLQDLRYAARGLWNNPGFAAVVVLSLAIGIGANTALFSVLNAVLLRPLPVAHPEQLFALSNPLSRSSVKNIFSYPLFERMRNVAGDSGIAAMSRIADMRVLIDGNQESEPGSVQLISGEFFGLTGLSPVLGRMISQEDNRSAGGRPVAVISHDLWQRRFGGSTGVLGRGLSLNGSHFTIVGVAPAGFTGMWLESRTDIWIPLVMQPLVHYSQNFSAANADADKPWVGQEGILWLNLVVRTRVHEAALDNLFRQSVAHLAERIGNPEIRRLTLQQRLSLDPVAQGFSTLRARYAGPLIALTIMVALVLLIACANTANLLLARANGRRSEIACRLALGAGRGRIIRQLLTESFLLALIAAMAGLAFSNAASELLVRGALGAAKGPPPFSTSADIRVLGFTTVLSILTTLLFGLAPAFRATRINLEGALRAGARGVREGSRINTQKLLVVSQMALTFILVVGAIWFADSLRNLGKVRLGFDKEHVVTVWINPQSAGYATERLPELYRRLVDSAEAVPGVRSASVAMCGLASGCRDISDIKIAGYDARPDEQVLVQENWIGPEYLSTVGMRLLEGRKFSERDTKDGVPVAIVSESVARRYFSSGKAIGRNFGYTDIGAKVHTEIVGVVEDARVNSAREEPPLMIYYPIQQGIIYGGSLEVRVTGDPAARMAEIRQAVMSVDRNLPITRITALSEQVSGNLRQDRLIMWLTSTFGLLALGLGCFGLYGVMSYAVARRMGELGIRLALGAPEARLFRMVLGESLALIAAGVAFGLPFVFALSRAVSGILYGVRVNDPVLVGLAALSLVATAAFTAFFPALRAAQLRPVVALRYE
ncbi:MAG TPA: ABC transporter permease [Bryobacteraceae bacterium]|jgi:predicted permease